MKKVGILTIFSVYNYGAMLQAYALCKFLNNSGIKAEIINYRSYFIMRNYSFFLKDLFIDPRNAIGALIQGILKNRQFKKFKEFQSEYIPTSLIKYRNSTDLKEHNYDTLITGSDQIWNPDITGFDFNYLVGFDTNKNVKKIAYSSSFGLSKISVEWEKSIKQELCKFTKIMLREQSACEVVSSLIPDAPVSTVLDPVFLLDTCFWRSLANEQYTPIKKYLLVYALETNPDIQKNALSLAKEFDLMIVAIHPFAKCVDFADLTINFCGPLEFLSLVDSAEYVVTNSFHGVAYSIIFNKKLCCIPHKTTGVRMLDLLEKIKPNKCIKHLADEVLVPIFTMDDISNMRLNKYIESSKESLLQQ